MFRHHRGPGGRRILINNLINEARRVAAIVLAPYQAVVMELKGRTTGQERIETLHSSSEVREPKLPNVATTRSFHGNLVFPLVCSARR